VRSPGSPAVYVIEGGKKRHITSPAVAQKYGYNLGNVRTFSDIENCRHPDGRAEELRTGGRTGP